MCSIIHKTILNYKNIKIKTLILCPRIPMWLFKFKTNWNEIKL